MTAKQESRGEPSPRRARAAERARLERMDAVLRGARRCLVLTHDNPDPDSIAAGWGLLKILRRHRRLTVDLAHGGIIGRGENRAMVSVLKVPLRPLAEVDVESYDAFALVDSQPETGNNSLPPGVVPHIVIDHHPIRRETRRAPYFDVREDYGATATIMSEYLLASELAADRRLATAFFYAIKAETRNLGRESSRADVRAFLDFFPRVDNVALSRIENPPIPRAYFSMIDQLIEGTRLHGRVAITMLGPVHHPDAVAEFADLLVRLEEIDWALAIGRFGQDLILSIRTNLPTANAGRIIQTIVGREGKAGGHGMMAGGKVPAGAHTEHRARELEALLRARALAGLKATSRGIALVRPPRL